MSHETILTLHAAVVSARLVESRAAMLTGIDGTFVAGLPHTTSPSDQILCDLDALSAAGELSDGSRPLAIWLMNVVALAGARKEAAIFAEALGQFRGTNGVNLRPRPRAALWPFVLWAALLAASTVAWLVIFHQPSSAHPVVGKKNISPPGAESSSPASSGSAPSASASAFSSAQGVGPASSSASVQKVSERIPPRPVPTILY